MRVVYLNMYRKQKSRNTFPNMKMYVRPCTGILRRSPEVVELLALLSASAWFDAVSMGRIVKVGPGKYRYRETKKPDPFKKTLQVAIDITEFLKPHNIKPVLTGDNAVGFYTVNKPTRFVDFLVSDPEHTEEVLDSLNFAHFPGGRRWYRQDIGAIIGIHKNNYIQSDDRINSIIINGMNIQIIGIEDLIIKRMAAGDREWTTIMLHVHDADIDYEYLKECSYREDIAGMLDQAMELSHSFRSLIQPPGQ